jgi:hypothetical protein
LTTPPTDGKEHTRPPHAASIVAALVLYHVAWLACVKEPTLKLDGLGLITVTFSTLIHLALFPQRSLLLRTAAWASVWGLFADAVLMRSGVLVFASPIAGGWLPPVWMVALWWNFGLLCVAALDWLAKSPQWAVLFGVVGGPLAYYGGAAMGAVTFGVPLPYALTAVAVEWGLTMWVWSRFHSPPAIASTRR